MTEKITTRVGVLPPPIPPKSEIIPVGEYQAIVDATDVELVSQYVWHPERSRKLGTIYAMAHVQGSTRMIKMHRLILGLDGPEVDHINSDGLDNRRSNLRHATRQQQTANARKTDKPTSSKFKGVTRLHKNRKWMAQIKINQAYSYIGSFEHEEDAARAYDVKAREAFGEYAKCNFD